VVLAGRSGATPEAIIRKINADLNAVLGQPELRQRFQDIGVTTRTMSPSDTSKFIAAERDVWHSVVQGINLKSQ
jgi:tripartite-type tricarboxylate transporter receptor subunit TctC